MNVKTAMLRCLVSWALVVTSEVIPMAGKSATPDFLWLRTAGGEGADVSYSIAVDPAGSSFIAGYFASTNLNFGGVVLTNANPPNFDAFVARFNPDGTLLWARSFGGTNGDSARAIAIDGQDNCYVTGYFYSTNFLVGNVTLTNFAANGYGSLFIAKFDPSGNLLWARGPDSGYSQSAFGIAVDAAGNCYVTGQFSGTATIGGINLVSSGSSDIFLLKYDPNGNLLWAQKAGGNSNDAGISVAVDSGGNAYLLAVIRSTSVIFGNFSFSVKGTNLDQDIIVAKYGPSGNTIWADQFGGTDLDSGSDIALDKTGNVFITGGFSSTNLVFGNTTLTNTGFLLYSTLYLAKLANDGTPLWAKAVHGDYSQASQGVAVDFAGNSYIAGYFQSSNLVFDTVMITNTEGALEYHADVFVAKYDPSGNLLWVAQPIGTNDQRAFSIAVDSKANAYITGWTQGTNVLFGNLATTNAYLDLFVAKMDSDYTFLQIGVSNSALVLSWPAAHRDGFFPEVSTNLQTWTPLGGLIITNNGRKYMTNFIVGSKGFFRLNETN